MRADVWMLPEPMMPIGAVVAALTRVHRARAAAVDAVHVAGPAALAGGPEAETV